MSASSASSQSKAAPPRRKSSGQTAAFDFAEALLFELQMAGFPAPEKEYLFHRKRKWRFDLAWPQLLIAIEIEGGVWVAGRHVRGQGYEADCEKYNEAQMAGWMVLRFTPGMFKRGKAGSVIEKALRRAMDGEI